MIIKKRGEPFFVCFDKKGGVLKGREKSPNQNDAKGSLAKDFFFPEELRQKFCNVNNHLFF